MPPTEQIDGKFYSSKHAFRSVGRAHGLVEVGTERLKPKQRTADNPHKRKAAIGKAVAQYRAGRRINPSAIK
jgi:hypothetical protein